MKKKSVLFSWLVSYLSVILLFIFVCILIFLKVQASYETEIGKSNEYLLEHTKSNMDSIINDIRSSASSIAMDAKIRMVVTSTADLSDRQYYDLNEVVKQLNVTRSLNKKIDDIVILNIPMNLAVTAGGVIDIKTCYKCNYMSGNENYQQWLKGFDDKITEKYFITEFAEKGSEPVRKINYIRSMSLADPKDLSSCIIISINEKHLIDQMNVIQKLNGSNIYILDSMDGIIFSQEKETLGMKFHYSDFKNDFGMFSIKSGSQKSVVSYIHSSVNRWIYISSVPEKVYLRNLVYLRNVAIYGVFVGLLPVIGLIYFFTTKNYRPVFQLMGLLKKQGYVESVTDSNEYTAIESAIHKTLHDKLLLDKQIYRQSLMLRKRFVERLLTGCSQESNLPIHEALHSYDIKFDSDNFVVMLYFIDENDHLQAEQDNYHDYSLNEMVFIISNVVEELVSVHHFGIVVECEEAVACLVNISQTRMEEANEDLLKVADTAQQFIKQHFNILFTVSISSVHQGIEKINDAYNESLDVMKYKQVLGIRKTLCFDDIKEINEETYYYPINREQQLINFMKAGDYQEAAKVIEEVFQKNLETKSLTPDLAQCLMLNLVTTMIRTVNEMSGSMEREILRELDPIGQLLPCKTIEDMKKQVYVFLQKLCTHISETKREDQNWVKTDVIPYVDDNYHNCNLSVSEIAEHFDVHPVYISRLFKEQTGEGLLDHINKVRVEKSKILLENKRSTIDDVAIAVGYCNGRTFTRTFKKYEGITPGKYREIL